MTAREGLWQAPGGRAARGLARACLALGVASGVAGAVGCSGTAGTGTGDGGLSGDGASEAGSVSCTPGQMFCASGGYYQCAASGTARTLVQTCTGTTQACVPGAGCVACVGSSARCDPDHPNTPEVCKPDNSGYVSQTACTADQTCLNGACMSPCQAASTLGSYLGCEYWPVTLKNTCLGERGGSFPFAVAVANPQATPVQVTVTGGALTAPVTQTVAANDLGVIDLPFVTDLTQVTLEPGTSVLRAGGAYHLTTNAPVTVYQFNPLNFEDTSNPMMAEYSFSNDASLLLPTSVLGSQYTVLTWPGNTLQPAPQVPAWESGGTVTIVGTSATPTTVNVTLGPMASTFAGTGVQAGVAGAMQTYTLSQGDVVQLLGHGGGTDLTGTVIQSSAPVAVYPGHGCAQVPADRAAGNHLEEQLFPDTAWGLSYAVSAFIDRPGGPSVIRVIARQDGTSVTFDPPAVEAATMLAAHGFVEFEATTDFRVTADKPILVAQFMYGGGLMGDEGDPAMVYEVPIEQYRSEYTFLTPATFIHSFVNIVGFTGDAPLLDSAPVPGMSHAIGASGLSVWSAAVMSGVHTVTCSSTMGCGIKVYGTAPYTAYAYPGGLDLHVIVPQ